MGFINLKYYGDAYSVTLLAPMRQWWFNGRTLVGNNYRICRTIYAAMPNRIRSVMGIFFTGDIYHTYTCEGSKGHFNAQGPSDRLDNPYFLN